MLVAGEAGKLLRIHAGIDLAAAEDIILSIIHPRTQAIIERRRSTGHLTVSGQSLEVEIERRDGAIVRKTLAPGTHIEYVTDADDLPDDGLYRFRLRALLPGGKDYRSREQTQHVFG